jgi:hypothetical protein
MAHDVFLSHSVKDKAVADAIVARLEAESVNCWIAPRDVVPGADWGESIIDAIESSRIMILIFSRSADASSQIKREVERAVNKGVYIIPFRVDDIPPTRSLEYFISTSQWMDAFSPPLERHLGNLAKTVKAVLKSPPLPGANAAAQSESESPMTTPQISPAFSTAVRPTTRPVLPGKPIAVAIAVLIIIGGAVWYLGQKREAPYITPAGHSTTQNELSIAKQPEVDTNQIAPITKQSQPENMASKQMAPSEMRTTENGLPVAKQSEVDTNQIAPITKQSQPENMASKQMAPSETPPIAEPLKPPQRGPWLFPDSSSRYLTPSDLAGLSADDLWRARNEIFARNGYKFSSSRGIAFARTLGHYYRGVDADQDRVFNRMNQYEQANVTLIQSTETGR